MKKINLKVSPLYAIYKQLFYLFLITIVIGLSLFFGAFWYVFTAIAALLGLRALYGIIYYRTILIEIFEDRIKVTKGVFSKSKSFMELYRIEDYEESQNLFMRIFNLMNVRLLTSDKSSPVLDFTGVPKSDIVEILRVWVEKERERKGVRLFE